MVQYMKQVAGVSVNSTTLLMQMPQSDLTHNIFFPLFFSFLPRFSLAKNSPLRNATCSLSPTRTSLDPAVLHGVSSPPLNKRRSLKETLAKLRLSKTTAKRLRPNWRMSALIFSRFLTSLWSPSPKLVNPRYSTTRCKVFYSITSISASCTWPTETFSLIMRRFF